MDFGEQVSDFRRAVLPYGAFSVTLQGSAIGRGTVTVMRVSNGIAHDFVEATWMVDAEKAVTSGKFGMR